MIIRKRSGERGHAFLSSLSSWKKGEAEPLIRILKVGVEMQAMIQVVKRSGKPRWISSILM